MKYMGKKTNIYRYYILYIDNIYRYCSACTHLAHMHTRPAYTS